MAYKPQQPPSDPKDLPAYLVREFERIAAIINEGEIDILSLMPLDATPDKPEIGTIIYGKTDVGVVGAEGPRKYTASGWALV